MKNKLRKWIYFLTVLLLVFAFLAVLFVNFGLPWERKTAANFATMYMSTHYYTECEITRIGYNYRANSYIVYVKPKNTLWYNSKEVTVDYKGTTITIIWNLDKMTGLKG